jgi:hypothetical protein
LPVALGALLHLFVDLSQRQAAGAFQCVGIGVICHGNGLFLMSRFDLDTYRESRQACAQEGRVDAAAGLGEASAHTGPGRRGQSEQLTAKIGRLRPESEQY